jgi:hypothetical protein
MLKFIKSACTYVGKKVQQVADGAKGAAAAALGTVAGLLGMGASGDSMAAVPAAITTAVTDMQADGVTIATAVVVAFFAVFTIKFLWRSK